MDTIFVSEKGPWRGSEMNPKNLTDRTNQKLNFARIHLDELKDIPVNRGRGSDFERAHHEAFLAQLFGAYYAFLHELNFYLGCGLPEESVKLGDMQRALKKQGKPNPILKELYELTLNEESWFKFVKDVRSYSTHVSAIPLAFKPSIGKTSLIHPMTKKEQEEDIIVKFSSWMSDMEQLIFRLRSEANKSVD